MGKSLKDLLGPKRLWLYRSRWLAIALGFALVAAMILILVCSLEFGDIVRLGLLQPTVAAILALSVVVSMRLIWGRFANERRKGVRSASSAAIAVRLWAMCFVLLVGAMLLSAIVARLPEKLPTQADTPPKIIEEHSEVKGVAGASTVSHSMKVTR